MTIYEKEQTIEAIKTVIRARWFYTSLVILHVLFLKTFFPEDIPLPSSPAFVLVSILPLVINFGYWLYLHQPSEKISNSVLSFIKNIQVPIDQLGISAALYFSGTVNKMFILIYFVPLIFASSLYKKKGVILATVLWYFSFQRFVCFGISGNNQALFSSPNNFWPPGDRQSAMAERSINRLFFLFILRRGRRNLYGWTI